MQHLIRDALVAPALAPLLGYGGSRLVCRGECAPEGAVRTHAESILRKLSSPTAPRW